jgi:selenide,water dikinase
VRRLLIAGGGHAHVEVLRRWARAPVPGVEVLVVSPTPVATYTGMVPAMLNGRVSAEAIGIDVAALARRAGARFVVGEVTALDGAARTSWVDGAPLPFDVASLDVGSAPAGLSLPGVRAWAMPVRPLARVLAVRDRVDALRAGDAVLVVGGGAAAVEIALALAARRRDLRLALVHDGARVLAGAPRAAQRRAEHALHSAGIAQHAEYRVARLHDGVATTTDGRTLAFAVCVWAAGAAPVPLLAASAVPRSPRGFLLVDATLRAADGAPVFGAGDTVDHVDHPALPKAGVHAVRQGPLLADNLRAALNGRPLRRYRPQRHALALLDLADGRALAMRGQLVAAGGWALALKDGIDRRFLARYR